MRTSQGVGSVPVHLTSFVGRQDELRAARDLLRRRGARLVTLTGPGGAGKSRLAAQVAAELLGELQDGARYVELAPVASADDVVPAIARALGAAQPDGSARLADLVEAVRDREILLVVDNFEHLLEAAPLLSDLLQRCPRLVVLVDESRIAPALGASTSCWSRRSRCRRAISRPRRTRSPGTLRCASSSIAPPT